VSHIYRAIFQCLRAVVSDIFTATFQTNAADFLIFVEFHYLLQTILTGSISGRIEQL
jgi:hypothetical protein